MCLCYAAENHGFRRLLTEINRTRELHSLTCADNHTVISAGTFKATEAFTYAGRAKKLTRQCLFAITSLFPASEPSKKLSMVFFSINDSHCKIIIDTNPYVQHMHSSFSMSAGFCNGSSRRTGQRLSNILQSPHPRHGYKRYPKMIVSVSSNNHKHMVKILFSSRRTR